MADREDLNRRLERLAVSRQQSWEAVREAQALVRTGIANFENRPPPLGKTHSGIPKNYSSPACSSSLVRAAIPPVLAGTPDFYRHGFGLTVGGLVGGLVGGRFDRTGALPGLPGGTLAFGDFSVGKWE